MAFAEDIKTMREDLGLSIQEAAKKIGVAYNTFKRYETGESTPPKERQDEIFIQLGNTEADSEIDNILNDIATQEIAKMKRIADENRLLLPLLRKLGYSIVTDHECYCWESQEGLRTPFDGHDVLLRDLEKIKEAIKYTLEEQYNVRDDEGYGVYSDWKYPKSENFDDIAFNDEELSF